jgi:mRNA interferase MazF
MTDLLLMKMYKKWDVVLVNLDPTKGSEIAKTRPCLVVSPNVVNTALNTLIIIPFTSASKTYPTRLFTTHNGIPGSLAFDQIKTIDKTRVIKKEGELERKLRPAANSILQIMFSEE